MSAGVSCVFVYADGTVGFQVLEPKYASSPVYRVPIHRPCVAFNARDDFNFLQDSYVEYTRRGHMFDDRPIFCAPGFDVKEAYMATTVTLLRIDDADQMCRRDVRNFVKREIPNAIELDERYGERSLPFWEKTDLEAQKLVAREARLMVAIRP